MRIFHICGKGHYLDDNAAGMTADRTFSSPILIPAYQPGRSLLGLVRDLQDRGARRIIIVNDGSGAEFESLFEDLAAMPGVEVLRHAVNLRKGAALKTGLNHVMTGYPDSPGAVTADADGQHHPEDIMRVAARLEAAPDALILGARVFDKNVPWRNRLGNVLTRNLIRLLVGQRLSDTQTGLRGIPLALIPHLLQLPSQGYEFELDMLIACKHQSYPIVEEPIRTIYLDGNRSSHFNHVTDSMRIYFLLFRFSILSLLTAALDNIVFALSFTATGNIARSQALSRLVAMIFNYAGARHAVFHSKQRHVTVFPKYILLVAASGFMSYALIRLIHAGAGVPVIVAKLIAEGFLFIANFAVQRDFVFTRRLHLARQTDWTRYYQRVPITAKLTRRYTRAAIIEAVRRFALHEKRDAPLSVIEFGGANSAFMNSILSSIDCASYDIVDSNAYGLGLMSAQANGDTRIRLHEQDIRRFHAADADLAFSVGLIEHFNPDDTRRAILAHFDALRPGGVAIISFPTPTLLYRSTRKIIEMTGQWMFHDERPLRADDAIPFIQEAGEILHVKTLWPLPLTQMMVVAKKRPAR